MHKIGYDSFQIKSIQSSTCTCICYHTMELVRLFREKFLDPFSFNFLKKKKKH